MLPKPCLPTLQAFSIPCTLIACGGNGSHPQKFSSWIVCTQMVRIVKVHEDSGLGLRRCTIICKSLRKLSTALITDCGPVPVVDDATPNSIIPTTFMTEHDYTCNAGYMSDSTVKVTCIANGTWTTDGMCEPKGNRKVVYLLSNIKLLYKKELKQTL